MQNPVVTLINLYQKSLSPDHSWRKVLYPYGYCRHWPSCSEYTKIAVSQFGTLQGIGKGIVRISHCHPWATPRVDLSCYQEGHTSV